MRADDKAESAPQDIQILDTGVDWLTLVIGRETSDHDIVLNQWYEQFHVIRLENGLVEAAHKLGYAGLATEGAFIGTRHDGAILMLSGRVAREKWLSFSRHGAHCTRLDVQVTTFWPGPGIHPPRRAAMQAEEANKSLPVTRQRSIRETHDNQEGYTTYIGSRQSASFARVYHKTAEDPDAYGPGAYRYEVQFNRDAAPAVVDTMQKFEDRQEAASIALVWDWYERRGVIPVFRRSGEVVNVSRETLPLTDLDRKLSWLYNQVRPTVGLLLEQDHQEEVLVALLGRELGKRVQAILANGPTPQEHTAGPIVPE